jgi:hypothetical protein
MHRLPFGIIEMDQNFISDQMYWGICGGFIGEGSIMRWVDDILRAFSILGGKAYCKELYREIGKIRGHSLSPGEKADIRKEIARHSSDSKIWQKAKNKRPDLFYSLGGMRGGYWARRSG